MSSDFDTSLKAAGQTLVQVLVLVLARESYHLRESKFLSYMSI